eukprot:CCRYP_008464-RD/>CCRYP_008464-RD protein AED:0.09 eAED:0.09 QI:2204/1/1/1/0.4/0.33/6/633/78
MLTLIKSPYEACYLLNMRQSPLFQRRSQSPHLNSALLTTPSVIIETILVYDCESQRAALHKGTNGNENKSKNGSPIHS